MKNAAEETNSMGNIGLCDMTVYDIPEVLEIEKLSFASPWSYEMMKNEIERNMCAKYIVAKVDGAVAGYAGMWVIIDEGHITNVAVHPSFRGMHVGDSLMRRLVQIGAERGLTYMTLEVRRSNIIAQNLYKKYEFYPDGVRPKYYGDNNEDAIIMSRRDDHTEAV